MQEIRFRAMGCQILAMLDRDDDTAARALEHVPVWFEAWEQQLSRFRPDSALMQLNAANGQEQPVPAALWSVLQAAIRAAQASDGLVTPTVLPAMEAIGYDRSFDGSWATADVPYQAATLATWRGIRLNDHRHTVQLTPGMQLDLGGIGKGWAAQRSVQLLRQYGPALVDAGGDIALSGACRDGGSWPIGITDPFHATEQLTVVELDRGGIATSGRDYRRWQQGNELRHHIIDPRTGQSAQTDLLSATVIAPNLMEAEMAAKVVLICGSRDGLTWIEARPRLAALLVGENGQVLESQRFAAFRQAELVS